VHSNERLSAHDVTTFHGPPFATVRDKPWWKKISLRIAMQFYIERRELDAARFIVPNSIFIRQQLAHYYPNTPTNSPHRWCRGGGAAGARMACRAGGRRRDRFRR